MTNEQYDNLSVGDIVEIRTYGPNQGKICRVTKSGWPVELELVNPHEVFLCRSYIGKRRMLHGNNNTLQLIKKRVRG